MQERLKTYGYNKLPEETRNPILVRNPTGVCVGSAQTRTPRQRVGVLGRYPQSLDPVVINLTPPLPCPTPPFPLQVYLSYMWNPLSWAMEAAAIIAIALLDYADFALIVALLLVNSTISYVEEANADKAIKALASGELLWFWGRDREGRGASPCPPTWQPPALALMP